MLLTLYVLHALIVSCDYGTQFYFLRLNRLKLWKSGAARRAYGSSTIYVQFYI
jgi:hypothetical protein